MTRYEESGVDLELGERCSQVMYEAAVATFKSRAGRFGEPKLERGGFSGPIYIQELRDTYILKNSDGVGTKVEVAQLMGKHDTVAYDLLAMVCDDAAAMGAEPFAVTDTLNVKRLRLELVEQLASGLVKAAEAARVAVVGGEIAARGDQLNTEYIWDADCAAVLEQGKGPKRDAIKPGDRIMALRSAGFRSNGFSLIRKILEERFGERWVDRPYDSKLSWGEVALTPSLIYTPLLVDLFGGYGEEPRAEIKGAAHITGGGVPENLPRILPQGLGAYIDLEPHPPMLRLQELGGVDDREAYRVWNMGAGMVLITNDDKVFELARAHGIEAREVGEVLAEPVIRIRNRGYFQEPKELVYER
jgi:phosphoribosylformylglycinamidine cyclo-ligase